jgi:diaminopimelate decarboxylase
MTESIIHLKDNKNYIEEVELDEICQSFGTPSYVYSKKNIVDSYNKLDKAFHKHERLICFAVKANPNIAILNILANLGAGFDIVSGGELRRVIAAKGDTKKVVFSGIGKSADEIKFALQNEILAFNVESEPELYRIQNIAKSMGKKANISIRVNPNVDAKTHPYISTGLKDNKFGVDEKKAIELYKVAKDMDSIIIKGIDCHIGSQITELAPFIDAISKLLKMVDALTLLGIEIDHLDIGGGIGINYDDEEIFNFDEYADAISRVFAKRKFKIIFEPGRAIVGKSGILLAKIEYIKKGQSKNFAVIDAAMNDLMRPSLYNAHHQIINISNCHDKTDTYDIVGPVCETGDFLGKNRNLSISPNNILAILDVGAYGMSMSSNYNSRMRPAELLIDGKKIFEIKKREVFNDLIRYESLPSA